MKNLICKSQRAVVEELIQEHIELSQKLDNLEKAGIRLNYDFFKVDSLMDWALDVVGFPQDTTSDKDEYYDKFFCRDYITDSTLLGIKSATHAHSSVEDYVDFLYSELENLKKESPELFL